MADFTVDTGRSRRARAGVQRRRHRTSAASRPRFRSGAGGSPRGDALGRPDVVRAVRAGVRPVGPQPRRDWRRPWRSSRTLWGSPVSSTRSPSGRPRCGRGELDRRRPVEGVALHRPGGGQGRMSVLDRFMPPPGAPGAVRLGAAAWRAAADRLQQRRESRPAELGEIDRDVGGAGAVGVRRGVGEFPAAVDEGVGLLRRYAEALDGLAEGIESGAGRVPPAGRHGRGDGRRRRSADRRDGHPVRRGGGRADRRRGRHGHGDRRDRGRAGRRGPGGAGVAGRRARRPLGRDDRGQRGRGRRERDGASIATGTRWRHVHWGEDAELALVGALAVPIGSAARPASGASPAAPSARVPPASPARLALGGRLDGALRCAWSARRCAKGSTPASCAWPRSRWAGGPVAAGATAASAPEGTIPLGFADAEEFAAFGRRLRGGLAAAGYRGRRAGAAGQCGERREVHDRGAVRRGSAQRLRHRRGRPALFARAAGARHPACARNPPRTPPLTEAQLDASRAAGSRRRTVGDPPVGRCTSWSSAIFEESLQDQEGEDQMSDRYDTYGWRDGGHRCRGRRLDRTLTSGRAAQQPLSRRVLQLAGRGKRPHRPAGERRRGGRRASARTTSSPSTRVLLYAACLPARMVRPDRRDPRRAVAALEDAVVRAASCARRGPLPRLRRRRPAPEVVAARIARGLDSAPGGARRIRAGAALPVERPGRGRAGPVGRTRRTPSC